MRTITLKFFLIMGGLLPMLLLPAPHADGKATLHSGLRYDIFTTAQAPETIGYEITSPLSVTMSWGKFVFGLQTAFSSANVYPGNGDHASINGLTDTRLSVSYGSTDLPVGLALGVEANLPTGQERLTTFQQLAEAGENHDLFEVDDFGEGLNLAVNAGLAEEFGAFAFGLKGRYGLTGEYDQTAEIADDDVNPGDQTLFSGFVRWQASKRFFAEILAAYADYTPDRRNGQASFQEGAKVTAGATFGLLSSIPKPLRLTFSLQQTWQGKNQEAGLTGLATEAANSNGPETFGALDATYQYSSKFAVRAVGDIRYYGASSRQEQDVPYTGRRIRYAFGGGWLYALNKRISLDGLAKFFILRHDRDIGLTRDTTTHGVNVSVDVTYNF